MNYGDYIYDINTNDSKLIKVFQETIDSITFIITQYF